MKWILTVSLLAISSLSAYEPLDYKQWSKDYMRDSDAQFDRMENSFNQREQNRILNEMLRQQQRAWKYGR